MYTNHSLVNIYRFPCSITWEERTVSWEGKGEEEKVEVGLKNSEASRCRHCQALVFLWGQPLHSEPSSARTVPLHVPSNCAYRKWVPSLRLTGSSMEKSCLHSVSRCNAQHLAIPKCLKMRLRKHMINVIPEGYSGPSTSYSARLQFCLMRVFLKALRTWSFIM